MLSDEELIATYQRSRSDEVADELVSRHIGRIRGFVFQMVLNDAAADDVTQEIFLRAFRALGSFKGHSQFSTWLYRIALNTTRTYIARQTRSPVECHAEVPGDGPVTDRTPDESILDTEMMGEIEAALAELSPSLRAAIVLTSLQGLDVQEAADMEGCTRATMYWRIHKARKLLTQKLDGYLSM